MVVVVVVVNDDGTLCLTSNAWRAIRQAGFQLGWFQVVLTPGGVIIRGY